MAEVVTVNQLLDGHVKLDIECLDRIDLNAYIPKLQCSGQVVRFLTQHLGFPIPSPALFEKIGQALARRQRPVQLQQAPAPSHLLLLLPLGRRLRPGLHQAVRLLPVPRQGLAQRA